jgi:hypothetical protein
MNAPGSTHAPSKRKLAVMHGYEVRPLKDHRGVDLISDALPWASQTQSATRSFAVAHKML